MSKLQRMGLHIVQAVIIVLWFGLGTAGIAMLFVGMRAANLGAFFLGLTEVIVASLLYHLEKKYLRQKYGVNVIRWLFFLPEKADAELKEEK